MKHLLVFHTVPREGWPWQGVLAAAAADSTAAAELQRVLYRRRTLRWNIMYSSLQVGTGNAKMPGGLCLKETHHRQCVMSTSTHRFRAKVGTAILRNDGNGTRRPVRWCSACVFLVPAAVSIGFHAAYRQLRWNSRVS